MKSLMGLISANYSEGDFGPLTQDRPEASLPFGGRYRLIDFPLSNMVNGGINCIGVITPYMYRSLMDHLGVGKEWALSRKLGGLYLLPGSIYGFRNIHSKYLVRDIRQNKAYIEKGGCDQVLICDCSKIYNIDFTAVEEFHLNSGADVTLVYKSGLVSDHSRERYLEFTEDGKVKNISIEPNKEADCFIDAFIINRELLLRLTSWYDNMSYMDLMDVFQENIDKLSIKGYKFDGYVGIVNNLNDYMEASMDLLRDDVRAQLFDSDYPICTKVQDSAPTKYMPSAKVRSSQVSAGCIIEGTVENSIIFYGVHICKGAVVKNCIIMQNCVIGENACLENIICDKYVEITPGARYSANADQPIPIGKYQEM